MASFYNGPYTKLITPPTQEPFSINEIKQNLKISSNNEDSKLESLIVIARQYAEQYMKKSLMPQSWEATYTTYIKGTRYLPFGPIRNIKSIKIEDKMGNSSLISKEDFEVNLPESYITFDHKVIK